jgi:hypothetical protein
MENKKQTFAKVEESVNFFPVVQKRPTQHTAENHSSCHATQRNKQTSAHPPSPELSLTRPGERLHSTHDQTHAENMPHTAHVPSSLRPYLGIAHASLIHVCTSRTNAPVSRHTSILDGCRQQAIDHSIPCPVGRCPSLPTAAPFAGPPRPPPGAAAMPM